MAESRINKGKAASQFPLPIEMLEHRSRFLYRIGGSKWLSDRCLEGAPISCLHRRRFIDSDATCWL
jgi:hypothetical protein